MMTPKKVLTSYGMDDDYVVFIAVLSSAVSNVVTEGLRHHVTKFHRRACAALTHASSAASALTEDSREEKRKEKGLTLWV